MRPVYNRKYGWSSLCFKHSGVDRLKAACYAVLNHRMTRNAPLPSIAKEIAATG
jgi:hypothetical protein